MIVEDTFTPTIIVSPTLPGQAGSYTFDVTISFDQIVDYVLTLTLTVNPVLNTAPTFDSDPPDITIYLGRDTLITLPSYTDIDGDRPL